MSRRQGTVLLLRALGLGDFVTGLPGMRMVRQNCPDHRIVLAAPTVLARVALATGLVDEVVHAHELEPIRTPPRRPDLAIDLHGNGPESRALLEVTEPGRLLAYAGGPVTWRAEEHEVVRWCRLLSEGLGWPAPTAPSVGGLLPRLPGKPVVGGASVLHCGAKAPGRRWPAERFAELARLLAGRGHRVVITAGASESGLARRIGDAAQVPAVADLTLEALLTLIADAAVVVSGDTGVAHVAAGYRVPSVTLFGPVSPARWGPPADARHQVLWHGDGTGDPHAVELDPALARITVDEVVPAVTRAMAAARESEQLGA
jgi:ADP-heptose:LPS heptosyltransferase